MPSDSGPNRAIIHVAVTTGLRLGEFLGLRWSDLDLDGGTASISRAAPYLSNTGITFRQPKSARSRRNIALSAETVRTLREHRRRQLERRLATGLAYGDQDLVFATAGGSVRPADQVQAAFRALVQRVGLGPVRFHDLRHPAATLMLRAGVPIKIVSCGHGRRPRGCPWRRRSMTRRRSGG